MKSIALGLIMIYKTLFSNLLKYAFGGGCRYQPTCSEFARDAIDKHGVPRGTLKSLARISRCQPWGGSGYDPA